MSRAHDSSASYTKQTHTCKKIWSPEELEILRSHPELSYKELSPLLPHRTPTAIRIMRSRIGRWASAVELCQVCSDRVVWAESARAESMGLCKGCYLHEMEHRKREDARANALRQSLFKERRRKRA